MFCADLGLQSLRGIRAQEESSLLKQGHHFMLGSFVHVVISPLSWSRPGDDCSPSCHGRNVLHYNTFAGFRYMLQHFDTGRKVVPIPIHDTRDLRRQVHVLNMPFGDSADSCCSIEGGDVDTSLSPIRTVESRRGSQFGHETPTITVGSEPLGQRICKIVEEVFPPIF